MKQKENCCQSSKNSSKGFLVGIIYGIIPHSFCIAFAVFSIIGSVAATAFLKKFMLLPNLFPLLVILSVALATISAAIYLKRNECLCVQGVKDKWKYITILYSSTILVNLLIFFVIIPAAINMTPSKVTAQESTSAILAIKVAIPCSGHASLIIDELKKDPSVQSVKYNLPDNFEIKYDPKGTSLQKITALEIFKTYPATVIN